MLYVKAYAATAAVFLAIDAVWLGVVAQNFYFSRLSHLLADEVNYAAAGGFYLAYAAGVVYFAVAPALAQGSWRRAALNGALLGLIAYGTYDMTNIATLRDWPVIVSVVDMAWGTVLTGTSALAGYLITRALTRHDAQALPR